MFFPGILPKKVSLFYKAAQFTKNTVLREVVSRKLAQFLGERAGAKFSGGNGRRWRNFGQGEIRMEVVDHLRRGTVGSVTCTASGSRAAPPTITSVSASGRKCFWAMERSSWGVMSRMVSFSRRRKSTGS